MSTKRPKPHIGDFAITDEQQHDIINMVKILAKGELGRDECGDPYCIYCDADQIDTALTGFGLNITDVKHKENCPILLARRMLASWGIPLNIYKIDTSPKDPSSQVKHNTFYDTAISPEEVDTQRLSYFWNILGVELVRTYPLDQPS